MLDITDMENVDHFIREAAEIIKFLDFLHELNYGEILTYIFGQK